MPLTRRQPLQYPSTDWQVVHLGPGLMLLVRPSASPVAARAADEIYRHYASGRFVILHEPARRSGRSFDGPDSSSTHREWLETSTQ